MRMLRYIRGISLKDHVTSEKIRAELGVAQIRDKVKEAQLRWFGHVKRSDSIFLRRSPIVVIHTVRKGTVRLTAHWRVFRDVVKAWAFLN